MASEQTAEDARQQSTTCDLTLDEVNDLLFQLEAYVFGYSREDQRALAVIRKLQRFRDVARPVSGEQKLV